MSGGWPSRLGIHEAYPHIDINSVPRPHDTPRYKCSPSVPSDAQGSSRDPGVFRRRSSETRHSTTVGGTEPSRAGRRDRLGLNLPLLPRAKEAIRKSLAALQMDPFSIIQMTPQAGSELIVGLHRGDGGEEIAITDILRYLEVVCGLTLDQIIAFDNARKNAQKKISKQKLIEEEGETPDYEFLRYNLSDKKRTGVEYGLRSQQIHTELLDPTHHPFLVEKYCRSYIYDFYGKPDSDRARLLDRYLFHCKNFKREQIEAMDVRRAEKLQITVNQLLESSRSRRMKAARQMSSSGPYLDTNSGLSHADNVGSGSTSSPAPPYAYAVSTSLPGLHESKPKYSDLLSWNWNQHSQIQHHGYRQHIQPSYNSSDISGQYSTFPLQGREPVTDSLPIYPNPPASLFPPSQRIHRPPPYLSNIYDPAGSYEWQNSHTDQSGGSSFSMPHWDHLT